MMHVPSTMGSILPPILDFLAHGMDVQDFDMSWDRSEDVTLSWKGRWLVKVLHDCISNCPLRDRKRRKDALLVWKHMQPHLARLTNRCHHLSSMDLPSRWKTKNTLYIDDLNEVAAVLKSYIHCEFEVQHSTTAVAALLHSGCVRSLVDLFLRVFQRTSNEMQRRSLWSIPQGLLLLCAGLSKEVCCFVTSNLECQRIIACSDFQNEFPCAAILWFCFTKIHACKTVSWCHSSPPMEGTNHFKELFQKFEPIATPPKEGKPPSVWYLNKEKAEFILEVLSGLKTIRPSFTDDRLPELVSKVTDLQVKFRKGQIEMRSIKEGGDKESASITNKVRAAVKEFIDRMASSALGQGKND